jgi:hypothetical protein
MQDHLLDIVKHALPIGIELVKVTGTKTETTINSIAEDRSVIVEAKFKAPVAEFNGVFGMPNLAKLNTILGIPEYAKEAKLTILTRDVDVDGTTVKLPAGVNFTNKAGDFKNDYRFMGKEVVEDKLKAVKFRGVKWNVEFTPSVASIQRLRYQAAANNEITTFVAKTEKGALVFYFGDAASHAGNFTFDNNVAGTLSKAWSWPVNQVIAILALAGEKTFKISDEGAAMITVDSGLIEYSYIIPAQTK